MDGDDEFPVAAALEADEIGRTKDPVWQVFNNDLLRGLILEKTIEDEDGGCSGEEIFNCRLICKSFLSSISHILKKDGVGMKTLYLRNVSLKIEARDLGGAFGPVGKEEDDYDEDERQDDDGDDEGEQWVDDDDDHEDKMQLLERTIEVFSSPDRLASISILPFALFLDGNANFLREKRSLNVLFKFLTSEFCSISLIKFHIWFPKTMDNFLKSPDGNHVHNFSFPRLLGFFVRRFGKDDLHFPKLRLIQNVLNGAKELETFMLRNVAPPPEKVPDFLKFPRTLFTLSLEVPLTSVQLQEILLVRNPLSNLEEFTVYIPGIWGEKEVRILEKFLEKFQENLEVLEIHGQEANESAGIVDPERVRIPVMKNVTNLWITGFFPWIWKSAKKGGTLAKCFPALKTFTLDCQIDKAWFQFLDGGIFESVTQFETFIRRQIAADEKFPGVEEQNLQDDNLTALQMSQICRGFPNLQSLETYIDQLGFPVLFREMRQLKTLKIDVDLTTLTENRAKWTQALLGITAKEIRRLGKLSKRVKNGKRLVPWEAYVSVRREEGALSILDLSELTHFKLATPSPLGKRLLTNLVFYQGLMKMNNLKTLEFGGAFKPTQKMVAKWNEEHGNAITYTNTWDEDTDNHDDD